MGSEILTLQRLVSRKGKIILIKPLCIDRFFEKYVITKNLL